MFDNINIKIVELYALKGIGGRECDIYSKRLRMGSVSFVLRKRSPDLTSVVKTTEFLIIIIHWLLIYVIYVSPKIFILYQAQLKRTEKRVKCIKKQDTRGLTVCADSDFK